VHSTASIGIVTSELGVKDADTVMRDADTAMYEAKRAGRGRHVVFHPSMHEKVARSASLEQDLRAGLPAGQLFPVYQPIVNLHDGEVVAVEALARWQHPVRGSVPPVEFIPVAEETGLIAAVGQQILERACTDFMRWRNTLGDRAPTMIAVNLSRAQLLDDTLIDDVRAAIGRSGIDPACLQLEITESLAAQDAGIQAALHRLKALGVTLALDDFGTGYSSLACLHQLPIDTVKIDRSFVRDAQQSDYHRVLIEATVQVARSLGLGTVAEGVETEGQMALMRSLRCGKAQGFLFSRPLGVADLERWVAERQGDLQPVA
jgi:EAL domain-containing protein (putative c-di-GMP-specific phosphodiesterase class I)